MFTKFSLRDDYLPSNGIMVNESKSNTFSLEMNYNGIREVNTNLVLTFRDKKYQDEFKNHQDMINSYNEKFAR